MEAAGADGSLAAGAPAVDPMVQAALDEVKTLGGCCKDSDNVIAKINEQHEKLAKQGAAADLCTYRIGGTLYSVSAPCVLCFRCCVSPSGCVWLRGMFVCSARGEGAGYRAAVPEAAGHVSAL